jgi:hypothetical protein
LPLLKIAITNARLAATQLWSAIVPANYNKLLVKYSINTNEFYFSRAELERILAACYGVGGTRGAARRLAKEKKELYDFFYPSDKRNKNLYSCI